MELQVFTNEQFGQVRMLEIDEQPYFVGKDVADILGYARADNAIRTHVDSEDKLTHQISASGQNRDMTVINESGLYSLILSSKLPQAKQFKRWVTSEVLPAIRKQGGYISTTQNALTMEDAFIQLFQTQKELKQEQQMIKSDIVYLKDEQPVNPNINYDLEKARKKAVVRHLGGFDSPAYQNNKLRNEVFSQAAKDFKELFKIPRYDLLKKKDIERAYNYWKGWQPPTNLRIEIEIVNRQTKLDLPW